MINRKKGNIKTLSKVDPRVNLMKKVDTIMQTYNMQMILLWLYSPCYETLLTNGSYLCFGIPL